jgi:hypothetical protein
MILCFYFNLTRIQIAIAIVDKPSFSLAPSSESCGKICFEKGSKSAECSSNLDVILRDIG